MNEVSWAGPASSHRRSFASEGSRPFASGTGRQFGGESRRAEPRSCSPACRARGLHPSTPSAGSAGVGPQNVAERFWTPLGSAAGASMHHSSLPAFCYCARPNYRLPRRALRVVFFGATFAAEIRASTIACACVRWRGLRRRYFSNSFCSPFESVPVSLRSTS